MDDFGAALESIGSGRASESIGVEIMNEMFRSYGFKWGSNGVEWSFDNVKKAFDEQPIWSTLDYMLLTVPVTKWGLAAARVSGMGAKTGLAAKAVTLGKRGGVAERAYAAHKAGEAGGLPFREAMALYQRSFKATTQPGRWIESRLGKTVDADRTRLFFDKLTSSEQDVVKYGWASLMARDKMITELSGRAASDTAIQQLKKVIGDDPILMEKAFYAMDVPIESAKRAQHLGALPEKAVNIIDADKASRQFMHNETLRVGMIDVDTWMRGNITDDLPGILPSGEKVVADLSRSQYQYQRRFARFGDDIVDVSDPEAVAQLGTRGAMAQTGRKGTSTTGGSGRRVRESLMGRTLSETGEDWAKAVRELGGEPLLNPYTSMAARSDVASVVATLDFTDSLVKSGVMLKAAKTPGTEGWMTLRSIIGDDIGKIAKMTAKEIGQNPAIKKIRKARNAAMKTDAWDVVHRLDEEELQALQQMVMGGPVGKIPAKVLDMVVDPIVADELKDVYKVFNMKEHPIIQYVMKTTTAFKLSKTALSPATHGRNFLSGIVFNSLASGRLDLTPKMAAETMYKALKGDKAALAWVHEAQRAGVLGYSYKKEIIEDIAKAMGKDMTKDAAALGASIEKLFPTFNKFATKGLDKATTVYGYSDDLWKMQSFMRLKKRFIKNGLDSDTAIARAAHEVVKFHPMYGDVNEFTKVVRSFVPFTSFTTETMRVWKNAMTYKPHWVYGWAHSSDWASELVAQQMGVTQQQKDAAQQALPSWSEGKKKLLLPWRDDKGSLQWLDMSYLIPLADMAGEAEKMEGSLFGLPPELNPAAGFGLMSNPLISTAAAATMGKDPFTGREVQPDLTERLLGVAVPEGIPRKTVGLMEHIARTLFPPLAPPGFGGMNMIELIRGDVDPRTGLPAEPNVGDTLAANVLGLRKLKPSEAGARSQIYWEKAQKSQALTNAWRRLEFAISNKKDDRIKAERARLTELYGSRAEFQKQAKKRLSRLGHGSLSKFQRKEARARSEAARGAMLDWNRGRKMQRSLQETPEVGLNP